MHQKHSENVLYHIYECPHTPGTVHTKETEILHNEMIMMPEGNSSNGQPLALALSSKCSLQRKVVTLEVPTIPESDLNMNPT